MANIATLLVKIGADIGELEKGLDRATKKLNDVSKKMSDVGKTMTTRLTLPIVTGFGLAVKAASDADETFSKFATVFRDVESEAESAFQTLRREYGLSSTAAKQLLGDTGDLLTGFGFTQDEALRLSTEVQKLAVDLASFTNYSGGAAGASSALTKALLGEREMVKSLGIAIMEEDVQKQMALNATRGLTFATERQAKAQATLDLAVRQSQNAIGDYARTSESFTNQTRLLQARISDLATEFGTILLPQAQKLVDVFSRITDAVGRMDERTKTMALTILGLAATGGPILVAVAAIAKLTTVILALNPIVLALAAGLVAVGAASLAMAFNIDAATSTANAHKKVVDALPTSYRNVIKQMQEYAAANGVSVNSVDEFTKSLSEMDENLSRQVSSMESELESLAAARNKLVFHLEKNPNRNLLNDPEKTQAEIDALNRQINTVKTRLKDYYSVLSDIRSGIPDLPTSTISAPNRIEPVRVPLTFEPEPMADIVRRAEDPLRPLEDLLDIDIDLPQKLFPPGSIGFIQEQISYLNEQMRWADNAKDVATFRSEIERLEKQMDELSNPVDTFTLSWENFSQRFQEIGGNFKAFLAGEISQAVISFGETLGRSLSGAENSWATTFEKIMLVVLDFASSLAKLAAGIGAVMLFIPGMQGAGAGLLAAASALAAISAGVTAGINKRAQNRQNRANSNDISAPNTSMFGGATFRMVAEPVRVNNREMTFAWRQGQIDWNR